MALEKAILTSEVLLYDGHGVMSTYIEFERVTVTYLIEIVRRLIPVANESVNSVQLHRFIHLHIKRLIVYCQPADVDYAINLLGMDTPSARHADAIDTKMLATHGSLRHMTRMTIVD